jgi:predicted RNase H-like nuclease (RuvC/YqgF family)
MNRQTLVIIGLVGVIILLLLFHGCEARNFKEEINLLKAAGDTLTKTKNKDGTETAKIALLQASNTKMFLKLQTQDEEIRNLQSEVKKNKKKISSGGSVTTFSTTTDYTNIAKTDSTKKDIAGCDSIFYYSNKDSTWVKYSIESRKDSTTLHLKVKNAYTVVLGREKIGFLKWKTIAEVTNYNIFTSTKSLRAFEVKDTRNNRISLGLQSGGGLLFTGKTINIGGYIGIGLNLRIL